jgi:hypothetical protein
VAHRRPAESPQSFASAHTTAASAAALSAAGSRSSWLTDGAPRGGRITSTQGGPAAGSAARAARSAVMRSYSAMRPRYSSTSRGFSARRRRTISRSATPPGLERGTPIGRVWKTSTCVAPAASAGPSGIGSASPPSM